MYSSKYEINILQFIYLNGPKLYNGYNTTRKHKINDCGIPREFVVKETLRGISEEKRFIVTRLS